VYASRKRSRVPRFFCLTCGHTLSRQTFAVSYLPSNTSHDLARAF